MIVRVLGLMGQGSGEVPAGAAKVPRLTRIFGEPALHFLGHFGFQLPKTGELPEAGGLRSPLGCAGFHTCGTAGRRFERPAHVAASVQRVVKESCPNKSDYSPALSLNKTNQSEVEKKMGDWLRQDCSRHCELAIEAGACPHFFTTSQRSGATISKKPGSAACSPPSLKSLPTSCLLIETPRKAPAAQGHPRDATRRPGCRPPGRKAFPRKGDGPRDAGWDRKRCRSPENGPSACHPPDYRGKKTDFQNRHASLPHEPGEQGPPW